MKIGQLAKTAGIPVETVRFYESRGLLEAPVRLANNYRCYSAEHVARLRFIRHCRSLDIGLDEIAKLVHCDACNAVQAAQIHAFIAQHLEQVCQRIAELTELRENLLKLACQCHGHSNGTPCGILRGLENASVEKPDSDELV